MPTSQPAQAPPLPYTSGQPILPGIQPTVQPGIQPTVQVFRDTQASAQFLSNQVIGPVPSQFIHPNSRLGIVSTPTQVATTQFMPGVAPIGSMNPMNTALVTATGSVPSSFIAAPSTATQPHNAIVTINPALVTGVTAAGSSYIGTPTPTPEVAMPLNPGLVTGVAPTGSVPTSYFPAPTGTQPQFTNPQGLTVSTLNAPVGIDTLSTTGAPQVVQGQQVPTSVVPSTQPLYSTQPGSQISGPSHTTPAREHTSLNLKDPPGTPERTTHVLTIVSSPRVSPHIGPVHTPVKETSRRSTTNTSTTTSTVKILNSPIVVQKSEAISNMESRLSSLETNLSRLVTFLTVKEEQSKSAELQTPETKEDTTPLDQQQTHTPAIDQQQTLQDDHTTPKGIQTGKCTVNHVNAPSSPEMFGDEKDEKDTFDEVQPEVDKILQSRALQQDSWDNNAGETSFPSFRTIGSVKSYDNFEASIQSSSSSKVAKRKKAGRPKNRS